MQDEIEIFSVDGNHVKMEKNFEAEVEAGGLYKLIDDGFVVGPFGDLNEMFQFITE